jgi:hypothetical protein
MKTWAPVFIKISAVVFSVLMRTLNNKKPGTDTQGEAVKTNMPCPNGVSA